MNKQTILYKTLARALSMKRPHDSEGTKRLTDWLEDRAVDLRDASVPHMKINRDGAGNLHIDTRTLDSHRTLFVAHVDTVHRDQGPNKIRKTDTHWHADGAPLGADDGAGVAMLMHLIHSGINAYFVFSQGEECGGIGAKWLAKYQPELLDEFDHAIAFDRRGIDSVITHQGYGRCCSDAFADALSAALNADDTLMYLPDSTGVYTDTAEFTDVIPECTNISVGYYSEHSDRESLDIMHIQALATRCALIDWDSLPTDRDPKVVEYKDYDGWGWGAGATSVSSSFARGHYFVDDDTYAQWAREELRDAIYDAMAGSKQWLIELMCESVYPEDPEMAEKFIDRDKLDDIVLDQALKDCTAFEPDVVMCYVFDQVYAG